MPLSAEQIRQLQQRGVFVDPATGQTYNMVNTSGVGMNGGQGGSPGGMDGNYGDASNVFGNAVYGVGSGVPGSDYSMLDSNFQATGQTGQYGRPDRFMDFIENAMPLALAGVGFGAAGGFGNLFGGGAGAGAGGGSGAFLGEGALSGVPAWDGALSAAQAAGAAGGVGAGAASGGGGAIETMASLSPVEMSIAEIPGPMSTGGSLLSRIGSALGGSGGLLGTALGAAAGSQGQSGSSTAQRDIPEWLKPYVTGSGGVLDRARGLLEQQSAPEYQQAYNAMRTQGQGLLNTPQLGNGFDRFFPNGNARPGQQQGIAAGEPQYTSGPAGSSGGLNYGTTDTTQQQRRQQPYAFNPFLIGR